MVPKTYNNSLSVTEESLMAELSLARSERREIEKRREDLVRKAKQLQTKAAHRRNQGKCCTYKT